MGFKDTKHKVLECLSSGNILHEIRQGIDVKNVFAKGQVTVDEVSLIIARAKGTQYELFKYFAVSSLDIHILKTRFDGQRWYIKWYYVAPNSVFVSVHH
jgi:hypothetical protein